MQYPVFYWERYHGRLSPSIRFQALGTEGQRMADMRDVPCSHRTITDAEVALGLDELAKLYPPPEEQ